LSFNIRVMRAVLVVVLVAFVYGCGSSSPKSVPHKPPSAPRNVELSVTPQGLQVQWEPVKGASHYTVFWGHDREDYKRLMNFDQNATILSGLKKGMLYSVVVTSWNHIGESDYSVERLIVYDDNPRHASHYLSKGNQLLDKGLYVEAQPYLSAAIGLDPHNAQAYRSRALLYEKMNRHDLAKRDYSAAERVLKSKPLTQTGIGLSQSRTTRRD